MRIFLIIIGILFLFACAGIPTPTPQQLATANYGPFPEDWEKLASSALAAEIIRPETLRIHKMQQPRQLWVRTPDGEEIYGWGSCGFIVMGISRLEGFFVLIRDGKVIYEELGFKTAKRLPGKTWFNIHGGASWNICQGLFN